MINFSQGDMFAKRFDILVNTVNCVGAMGKGIALTFRDTYPAMYEAYRSLCEQGKIRPGELMEWKPGAVSPLTPGTIINFPTKRHYRDTSRYDDIDAGLIAFRKYLSPLGNVSVGLPPLGCGNGGLDWSIVSQMIFERLSDVDADITVFEPRADDVRVSEPVKEKTPVKAIKIKGEVKPKGKKPPSDFEIVRTILTRTHERKLPYLLKNMGEDSDILMLCSCDEDEFTYGSPDLAIALIEISDPELKAKFDVVLSKLYGIKDTPFFQGFINIRDQISELVKTKGESMDVVVEQNIFGSAWTIKTDVRGQERTQYYSKAIESLYHVQNVKSYCRQYRALLSDNNPNHYYYPYSHPKGPTATVLTIPMPPDSNHPLVVYYPDGFRTMATRGIDVIIDTCLNDTPYPSIDEELIVFQDESIACHIAHRITAVGWKMVLIRPNAVFFPTLDKFIPKTGLASL